MRGRCDEAQLPYGTVPQGLFTQPHILTPLSLRVKGLTLRRNGFQR